MTDDMDINCGDILDGVSIEEKGKEIFAKVLEVSSGARNIDNILSRTVLPELSARILARLADGHEILQVKVGMNDDGSFRYDVG